MRIMIPDSPRAILILTALLVAACGLAVGLALTSTEDGGDGGSDNVAFVDQEATSEILRDTEQIVATSFSVEAGRVPATRKAVRKSLVGDAVKQYDKLYAPFLTQAAKKGVSLQTTPRSLGIVELSNDDGRMLVLADQSASTLDGRGTTGAARFELEMERHDGVWKVSSIDVL